MTVAKEKLADLRQIMHEQNVQVHVVTMLDSIAWLFNIRGKDVDYNPVAISYALVTSQQAILFIDTAKITSGDQLYLQSQGITVQPYTAFSATLNEAIGGKVWIDPYSASWWVAKQLTKAELYVEPSPIQLIKPVKIQLKSRACTKLIDVTH